MSQTLDGKRVLLVDDDNDILTSMQAAFEPTGAVIESANNGNKAVELAEKSQPDLVVLDISRKLPARLLLRNALELRQFLCPIFLLQPQTVPVTRFPCPHCRRSD